MFLGVSVLFLKGSWFLGMFRDVQHLPFVQEMKQKCIARNQNNI